MVIRLLDLFSGIGGFSYAAEKLVGGNETVAFCEQDEFCQQVLRKHWKDVPIYDDVRTIDATGLGNIDIVAGGFPCQAVSQAGLQKATEDDRWLWDEMLRIIQDCKPRWVIGENVVGLININQGILFEQVQTDLEKEGYSVQSVVIPAASKNAPHRRDRVWIIANTNNTRNRTSSTNIDKEQQTIAQEWKEQSLFEPSRHNEVMADTENRRGEQTEWQGWESSRRGSQDINGSETEREETDRSDATYSESEGLAHSNEREICETKQPGMDSDEKGNWCGLRSKSSRRNQLSGENVADTERKSINDTNSGWNNRFEKEKQKTRTTHGSSGGQDVSNSNSHRSETRLSGQIKGQKRDTEKSINRDNRQRGWETSNDKATKQRMGDLVNGISKGLLEHFDREPEDIPRVTSGEKDRANKLKALGNSIVPQVAAEIFIAIKYQEEN